MPDGADRALSSIADRQESTRLSAGHVGDHTLVYSLLRAVNQAPAHDDFISWMDEPSYEPSDRLLVKRGDQLIAHAQLLRRAAWFHGVKLPVAGLRDVAILPEYAHTGCERLLVAAAESAIREDGAVLSLVRTTAPDPLAANGWEPVRIAGYSQANVNDVLAYLISQCNRHLDVKHAALEVATIGRASTKRPSLAVRLWRQVELAEVRSVYDATVGESWGTLVRSDPYWQWLVGRMTHGELIVAVVSSEDGAESQADSHIVGYAVIHGSQVLELFCLPGFSRAAPKLLARACQDAIEHDYHTISLHTSANDPLHELIVTAGGTWCSDHGPGGLLVVKLIEPARWIAAIFPLLRQRARVAGLRLPLELGFDTGETRFCLVVTRRSSRLIEDESAPGDVGCAPETLGQLLIGNVDLAQLRHGGSVDVQDEGTFRAVAALFPPALFWQSQFDMFRF
jgi:predicted acetyltransferase